MRFEKVRVGQEVRMKASERVELEEMSVEYSDEPFEIVEVGEEDEELDICISNGDAFFWVNAEWLDLVE